MKNTKNLIIIISLVFLTTNVFSQGLTIGTGGMSFAKGNIDTEVLNDVLESKRDELEKYVFKNLIIKEFNRDNENRFNNFTTYYLLYNIMDNCLNSGNSSVLSKKMIGSLSEFAYIYGFALHLKSKKIDLPSVATPARPKDRYIMSAVSNISTVIDNAKNVTVTNGLIDDNIKSNFSGTNADAIKEFNLLIDLCYDVLLRDGAPSFHLNETLSDDAFFSWYNEHNKFIGDLRDLAGNKIDAPTSSTYSPVDPRYTAVVAELANYKALAANADETINQLHNFVMGLKRNNYTDYSITEAQVNGIRFIIRQFLEIAENKSKGNVISTVIDMALDNITINYTTPPSDPGNPLATAVATSVYIDAAGLITEIANKYYKFDNYGALKYITPFVSIGINYASFINSNNLTVNSDGTTAYLPNLYYASEKIGVKWKLWNWNYTHSFAPGELFSYYNKAETYRYWQTPQKRNFFNDIHVIAYGSGILYNLVNLKSEKKFNYAIAGVGIGATAFNGLSVNISYAIPFSGNNFTTNNAFVNFGLDIPITDYLQAVAGKRKKN